MNCRDNRFGKDIPHFSICREYIHDHILSERRNQKRMKMEAIPSQPPPKTVQKKKHSMEILQEAIDHTIWEVFEQMEVFEFEDDYTIQYDQPTFDFTSKPFYSVIIE